MKISKKSQVVCLVFVLMAISSFFVTAAFAEEPVDTAGTTPPLVTFIADDGNAADFTLLKPLSDQYKIPFTSALLTSTINEPNSMTIEQLNVLYATGRWEFVSHTVNHPFLTEVSDTQLNDELSQSQQWLMSKNLGNGYQYLVYPYGRHDSRVMDAAMKYYKAAFNTVPKLNSAQVNPASINRIPLGAWTSPGEDTVAYYKSKVDEAIANGEWLVFMLHPGAVSYGHNNADLETVIQYIQSKNVPIVTINEAMQYYTPVPVNVTEVTVSEVNKTVIAGTAFNLTATVLPENATNKAVTWSSDQTDIATVDASGKVTTHKTGTATVTVTTADGSKSATCLVNVQAPVDSIKASYQTHVQNVGWQGWKADGQVSGTSGQSLRLEGIEINVDKQGYDIGIAYQTHIQNIGWEADTDRGWKSNGAMSGTSGQSLRLEAIQIKISGADADKCDVYYQVHAQNYGWLGWAKNGDSAGTEGFGYRLEGIKIVMVPKGSAAPGSTEQPFVIK